MADPNRPDLRLLSRFDGVWAAETESERRQRSPYVTIVIRRRELAETRAGEAKACAQGLALFDAVSGGKAYARLRWDALAAVWSAAAYPDFAGWVRRRFGLGVQAPGANLDGANLVRANLYGANLYGANLVRANLDGAYRRSEDTPVPGHAVVDGRLRRAP